MALSGGSSQLQTGDKLLAEIFLMTENDVQKFFHTVHSFSTALLAASEKSAALWPMTL